jgi:hypothetical protein
MRWSGRRVATSAQNLGPCPKTRRCASSWQTTVSSASGGARINRHENESRPEREALPQRVRGSRSVKAAGLTPNAAPCSATTASITRRASIRSHVSRIVASGRRYAATRWMTSSSSNDATVDRRTPDTAGTTRTWWSRPRNGMLPPSRAPPRAAIRRATSACCPRCLRSHGSRSARNAAARRSCSGRSVRAGTVTTTPRSGWMTTRSTRARDERLSGYGSGPPGRAAIAAASDVTSR